MGSTDAADRPSTGAGGADPAAAGEGTDASAAASTELTGHRSSDDAAVLAEVDLRITSLDLGDEAVFVTDPDGTIIEVNDGFVRVTGYSRDEAIGSTPRLLSSGFQDDDFYRDLWRTISAGHVWQGQLVDRRRDGALRTFHATISPIVDGHGEIRCFVALERDVTGELGTSGDATTSGLLHTDLHGRGTYADGVAAAMLDRRPSELLGVGLLHALDEEDLEAFKELIERAVETGREHHSEVRSAAGRWLRVTVAPLTVTAGEVLGATCVVEDVDDQIGAERAVQRQKALVDSVLNAFDEPLAVVGPDARVVAINRTWGSDDAGVPDLLRHASIGDDLHELAHLASERAEEGTASARLVQDLQRTLAGVLAPPRRSHGYRVTPLAWDDGGAVVRWLGHG